MSFAKGVLIKEGTAPNKPMINLASKNKGKNIYEKSAPEYNEIVF